MGLSWSVKSGGTKSAPTPRTESSPKLPGSSTNPLVMRLEDEMTVTIKDGLMDRRTVADELIEGSLALNELEALPLSLEERVIACSL